MNPLTHGSSGLLLAYLLTAAGLAAGMLARQARRALRIVPLLAVPTLIVAAILWGLLQAALWPHGPEALHELVGALFLLLIGAVTGHFLPRAPRSRVQHRRGALLAPHRAPDGAAPAAPGVLSLSSEPIPAADEAKHFKLLGTTGTGKTTAIRELLAGALARGDRAVIADPDGGYCRLFYNPERGDQILNPFEPRAARWDLVAELQAPHDAEQLARAFIPDHDGLDRNWRAYARTFLTAILRQLHVSGTHNLATLYHLLVIADAAELRDLLAATPAAPFLGTDNGKFFESVRSIAVAHLAVLEHLARQSERAGAEASATGNAGEALSVRRWVREGRGVLFLPYRAGQIAALRQALGAWLRLAIFETLSGEEGGAPLWFVIDELDALGAIDGLKDALARLRKFGGRCVLGIQSIAQVRGTYGDAEAQTIVENCGNTLILRCSASERGGTAEFASRLIGRREIVREHVSRTRPRRLMGFLHETRTASLEYRTEDAVLAAEIEQLPDREGFLKFASEPVWRRVTVPLPAAAGSADTQMQMAFRLKKSR